MMDIWSWLGVLVQGVMRQFDDMNSLLIRIEGWES